MALHIDQRNNIKKALISFTHTHTWKAKQWKKNIKFSLKYIMKGYKSLFQYTKIRMSKHVWHNARCAAAKKGKDLSWRKLKKLK